MPVQYMHHDLVVPDPEERAHLGNVAGICGGCPRMYPYTTIMLEFVFAFLTT
jgi:hypothetical protein